MAFENSPQPVPPEPCVHVDTKGVLFVLRHDCAVRRFRCLDVASSLLKPWTLLALLMSCVLGTGVCASEGKANAESFAALPASEVVANASLVSLPTDERASLLRAAAAALQRNPDPLPVVHVEGTLPTLPSYQKALQARQDWGAIAILANAYAINREPRHLGGYALYLAAWLDVYRISGNPIDETALGDWLLAYRLAGAALPPALAQRMRQFGCDLAVRYTQAQPPSRKTSTNNWQSHRVKLAVMGAHVCGQPALIAAAEVAFARQIQDNLVPSGESVDFAERDAIHYVVYSVEPLLEAALFAHPQGHVLFATTGATGQSISRTLDWLAPYARGDRSHEEFVHSQVRFDAQRAAAGVPGFAGPFLPKKAQFVYWLAAQMDPKWHELSEKLGRPPITRRASWLAP